MDGWRLSVGVDLRVEFPLVNRLKNIENRPFSFFNWLQGLSAVDVETNECGGLR